MSIQFNNESVPSSPDYTDFEIRRFHATTERQLKFAQMEESITLYLKSVGLKFNTDGGRKQKLFQARQVIQIVKESQSPITPILRTKMSFQEAQKQTELYTLNNNPIRDRRRSKQ